MLKKNLICSLILVVSMFFSCAAYAGTAVNDNRSIILPAGHAYIMEGFPEDNHASYKNIIVGGKGDDCSRGYVFFNIKDYSSKNKYTLKFTAEKVSAAKTIAVNGYKYPDAAPASIVKAANISSGQIGSFSIKSGTTYDLDVTDYISKNISRRKNIAFLILGDDKAVAEFNLSEKNCGFILESEVLEETVQDYEPIDVETLLEDTAEEEKTDGSGNDKPASDDLNSIRASQTKVRKWPEIADYPDYVDIDDYTTTYYKPWLLNYHFTEPVQVERDYKGGEGGKGRNVCFRRWCGKKK